MKLPACEEKPSFQNELYKQLHMQLQSGPHLRCSRYAERCRCMRQAACSFVAARSCRRCCTSCRAL
jgi:hypothetical protein